MTWIRSMNQPYTGARMALEQIARATLPITTQVRIFGKREQTMRNRSHPQGPSWGSVNGAGHWVYGQRQPNFSPLVWGGIGLGVAAMGAGSYYIWRARQAANLVEATGIEPNDDCTKLTVTDPDVSLAYFASFIDAVVANLGDTPVDTLILGASYLQDVAPTCGVSVSDQGIEGLDTWQKAAMVGGLAMLASGGLQEDGRMTPEQFNDQAEAIQAFLLENGVDDLAMVEEVFEMPESETTQAGGSASGGAFAARVSNRHMSPARRKRRGGREPNLGLIGILGWGALSMGVAAVAGAGLLWNRNRKVTEACLGETQWLEDDGSLSEAAEAQLEIAVREAIADGATTAVQAADAAIVKVSGNPDCRLPNIIWGDLLRVRTPVLAMAALILDAEDLTSGDGEGPGPDVTGFEANLECNKLFVRNEDLARYYFDGFMDESGMVPDTIAVGASFLKRIAPQCGVGVDASGEILGVDTWQKAAMVGGLALVSAGVLKNRGVLTDAEFGPETVRIGEWLRDNGVDDLAMIEEVIVDEADTGFGGGDVDQDEWGEPLNNDAVDSGTVGGEGGGRWRVYRDNAGKYASDFYYVIWLKETGALVAKGGFDNAEDAAAAALLAITSKEAGVKANMGVTSRFRRRITNPVTTPKGSRLQRRIKSRNQTVVRRNYQG